jgi:hypothetical protein
VSRLRTALTTGKHQHQRELNDARERASAEGKIETMSPYPTDEFKREALGHILHSEGVERSGAPLR